MAQSVVTELDSHGIGVRFPVREEGFFFSHLHSVQNGSGAYPNFYTMGTGGKETGA
jgi:hypothetical protein